MWNFLWYRWGIAVMLLWRDCGIFVIAVRIPTILLLLIWYCCGIALVLLWSCCGIPMISVGLPSGVLGYYCGVDVGFLWDWCGISCGFAGDCCDIAMVVIVVVLLCESFDCWRGLLWYCSGVAVEMLLYYCGNLRYFYGIDVRFCGIDVAFPMLMLGDCGDGCGIAVAFLWVLGITAILLSL